MSDNNEIITQENTVSSTEKKKFPIYHIIYPLIILLLIGVVIGGYMYLTDTYEREYTAAYNEAIELQSREYKTAKEAYDTAYAELIDNQKNWEAELASKQEEVNKAYDELNAVYAERQAEIDAEKARWDALSDAEKQAELVCNSYNEMVTYLIANDSEYATLYVDYSAYLTKDIFNLGREEALEYTKIYEKKAAIEQKYLSTHPLSTQ